jgi:multiple sugar transport system permease protein
MGQKGDMTMRKKSAGLPLYIVMAVLCTAVLFPVILAVILPFQAHSELKDTLSPL